MRRTAPSPKRQGLVKHEPRQLNPNISALCPEVINVSSVRACLMIAKINSEHADRHLEYQSAGDQLELLRLEALRLKIMGSMDSVSHPPNEVPPQRATPVSTESLGEPGPTVPNSMRTSMRPRAAVLSESEISVLDLGPSLHSPDSPRASRRNSMSANAHRGLGITRTTAPSFMPGPGSDTSDKPVDHRLHTDDLESVALTSASGSVNNEFPLNLRQRRQNRANVALPGPHELRTHRVNRSSTISEATHGMRDRFRFDHSPTFFADESNRRIHSLSVPQSPQSPPLPPLPTLRRAQSSFNGMEPAFAAMRITERVRRNARDAAGSQDADHN
ncbi:hypothetical protein N7491_005394 [Penicillium cf. griseofulvum]|uniref:Uncharacterized protein n=1 Tax=Penicillium cf. griseofulvum TaxID=2972120 RepID=A0A9W9M471_9EURO|nr:hypothetical protein N7472_008085 [Penicillium cf. griseofulvum]KAJ5434799.1 hypothetical protein N7491_005394 [Penicillium cf. griseofulvum]KAJ5452632.1 hypothetical protein N7445_000815 [Penicillium cf. griseofulvum]